LWDSSSFFFPWPHPQNPAEFLGDFSTIFFLQGRVVSPTPNPHPGGPGIYKFKFPKYDINNTIFVGLEDRAIGQ
jgi:hypothetical protein